MTQVAGENDLRGKTADSQISDQLDEPDIADISGGPAVRTSSMDPAEGPDDPDYDGE